MDFRALYLRLRFWINDFFVGSPIRSQYKEIKFISESPYEKGCKIRQERLNELLTYVSLNTDFYRNYSLNLSDYPVMNKNLYRDNYDKIKISQDKIPNQIGTVHIQKTSGSTGTPFAVPQDTRKRQRRIAELKYFGKIVGFNSHEKLIHLRTWNRWQNKSTQQVRKENIIPYDISCMGG